MQKQEKLKKKSQHDPLTGILNVKAGKEFIQNRIDHYQENDYNALFIMDIDNFKQTNDTFGHMTGDQLLIEFAKILKHTFRAEDIIYRIGGDEFAVFVQNIHNPYEDIELIMKRFFLNFKNVKIQILIFLQVLGCLFQTVRLLLMSIIQKQIKHFTKVNKMVSIDIVSIVRLIKKEVVVN